MTFVFPTIQSIGLACVPIDNSPLGTTTGRRPAAAAVVTLKISDDGIRRVSITCMSDTRSQEFPLPALVNATLLDQAQHIASRADCQVLAAEAAGRRFFVEPMIARLARGNNRVDPVETLGLADEAALLDRLGISRNRVTDEEVAEAWRNNAPGVAESVALSSAVSRLVLSAHVTSTLAAAPDFFFEVMLPLREALFDLEQDHPAIGAMLRSLPFNRAAAFATEFRNWRRRRDAGERVGPWQTFEDGLFHT